MTAGAFVGIALAFAAFTWRVLIWWERRAARKMLTEFRHQWPDRCPICAFDRAAARDGVTLRRLRHPCPEQPSQGDVTPAGGHEVTPG